MNPVKIPFEIARQGFHASGGYTDVFHDLSTQRRNDSKFTARSLRSLETAEIAGFLYYFPLRRGENNIHQALRAEETEPFTKSGEKRERTYKPLPL